MLRRAKEKRAIVRGSGIDYDERDAWIPNITRTQASPSCFDGVVVSRSNAGAFPSLEDLDLPPTAAEPIPARTMEYVRVSRTLLSASPEVHFIDAYLDPCDADRKVVLQELLRAASTGRCDIAHVWVSNNRLKRSSIETIDALRRIAVDVGFTTPRRMYLHPFTDAGRSVKVHDRYLLSLYGAIQFEHGFQELSGRRTAKVSPEAPNSHLLLVKTFLEGDHDMDVQTSEIEF